MKLYKIARFAYEVNELMLWEATGLWRLTIVTHPQMQADNELRRVSQK